MERFVVQEITSCPTVRVHSWPKDEICFYRMVAHGWVGVCPIIETCANGMSSRRKELSMAQASKLQVLV
jgi:hypothetical protein